MKELYGLIYLRIEFIEISQRTECISPEQLKSGNRDHISRCSVLCKEVYSLKKDLDLRQWI